MKIVDCFIFYNEIDMLSYRLDVLNEHIDYFILVESTCTFAGKEKKLYYQENKHLFDKYNEKIIHVILEDFPYIFPNIDYSKNQQWENEHYQRTAIKSGIDKLQLNEHDILILSDVDEIPDVKILQKLKYNLLRLDNIYSLKQDFYYYNLNSKMMTKWDASKIMPFSTYKTLNKTCQELRCLNCQQIENGGWHLSYFGDKFFIQNKIINFSHQEFNNNKYSNVDTIENKIVNQTDLFSRENEKIQKISVKDNKYLPPYYETKLTKFILY